MTGEAEGWGFTHTSRKCHYFRGGFSLCGKYGFRSPNAPLDPDEGKSKDDCAQCRKALDREKAKVST